MKSGNSWTPKGRRPEPRPENRAGAAEADVSVGDWLNSVVESDNPADAPSLAPPDDGGTSGDPVLPRRPADSRPPRNHQTWWRRWRGGNAAAAAKDPPRREARQLREPPAAPVTREAQRLRAAMGQAPLGQAAPTEGRPTATRNSPQQVGDLHDRLNELSQQLQRLATKHDSAAESRLGRPRSTVPGQARRHGAVLTGAPPLRSRGPAQRPNGRRAVDNGNSVYSAASLDDVVAEIRARQRLLDGGTTAPPADRRPSANTADSPTLAEPTERAAVALPSVPFEQAEAEAEATPSKPVAEPAQLTHDPLLPEVSFDTAPAQQLTDDQSDGSVLAANDHSKETTGAVADTGGRVSPDTATPDAAAVSSGAPALNSARASLEGLEQQLRLITSRIEALRPTAALEEAVGAVRADLVEISRLLTEALPRRAVESLENEVNALDQRIHQSRQSGVDADALAALERGLNEVRDALLALTPAENLVGFRETVQALAHKVDLIVAKDDQAALSQLEAAISGLRGVASHVASNETLTKVAEDVRALSERIDGLANMATGGQDLSGLENRIDVLANAITASTEAGQSVPRELEKLLSTLVEKLEWVQLTHTDHAAMAQLEDRVGRLVQRVDESDSRLTQLDSVEHGLADVMAHVEEIRSVGLGAPAGAIGGADTIGREVAELKESELRTQDSLEAFQGTVEHMVNRLAMIENRLRDSTAELLPPPTMAAPEAEPSLAALEQDPRPAEPEQQQEFDAPTIVPALPTTTALARKPLDPSLPPDHPLEPGSATGRAGAKPSAAERIAASEAAVGPAKPPVIDDPGGKSNFIAAARRAALAAAAAPYAPVAGARAGKAGKATDATATGRTSTSAKPRLRTLIFAAVAALIVVGCLQIATHWFQPHGATPLRTTRPDTATSPDSPTPQPQANTEALPDSAPPAQSETPAASPALPTPDAAPIQLPSAPANPAASQRSDAAPAANPATPSPSRQSSAQPPVLAQSSVPAPAAQATPAPATNAQPAMLPAGGPAGSAASAPQPAAPLTVTATRNAAPADKLPSSISPALRTAAQAGDAAAAYEVAMRFADGHGVAQNNELTAFWLDRAAKQGLAPAQFRLGGMYEKGIGVKKDLAAARGLYMAAAEQGNGKAMHNLAVLYAEGVDGTPDYRNAAMWFRKAADRGITDSQYNLAILYARGVGVEQNYAESYKWFALAGAQGDKDAVKKSEEIAAHLDPQTLAAAKLAVKNWTAEPQPDDAVNVKTPPGGWDTAAAASPSKGRARPAGAKPPAAEPKVN